MDPKIIIKRDRYSRLTYIVETEPGAPFLYRRMRSIPLSVQARVHSQVVLFLRDRGLELVESRYEPNPIAGAFDPRYYDWARADIPDQYRNNAANLESLFTTTTDTNYWYVLNPWSNQLRMIGRVGGSRGKGRGINYRDRAHEECDRMSTEMRDFYRALPTHTKAA